MSYFVLTVLQERHVWSEDAGRSRRPVGVRSVRGGAHAVARKLHRVPELHGEVAHLRTRLSPPLDMSKRSVHCVPNPLNSFCIFLN